MANIKKTKKYHLVKALWKTVSQYLLTLCAIAQNWQLLRCSSAEESGVAYSLAVECRTAKMRTLTTSHNTDVSKQCPVSEANIREKTLREPMCAKHKPTYCVRTVAILGVCSDCTGVQGGRASQGLALFLFLELALFLFLELGARNMVRP